MATSKYKRSVWASILGFNTLVLPSVLHAAPHNSYLGDGAQLSINDGDTIQANIVDPTDDVLYGLRSDPLLNTNFDLKNNVTIQVGDHPNSKYSFGIAADQPELSLTGQKLTITVDRQETGKAAGISHTPVNNPNTSGAANLNLGAGSSIHVKGSGQPPSGGGIPNITGYNNFAFGIGIWNKELTVNADQLTLDVESVHSNAYGISKSTGNNKSHDIDLGKKTDIHVKAGGDAYGISLESTVTNASTAVPSFKADTLTILAEGAGATALSVNAVNGRSNVDLGSNSQLTAQGSHLAHALNLRGSTQSTATDLTLKSNSSKNLNNVIALRMVGLGNSAEFLGSTQIESSRTGAYVYGSRTDSSTLYDPTQLHFEQVHVTATDYGMNIQGRVDLDLGTGSTIKSRDLAGIWLIASRTVDSGAKITMAANALSIEAMGAKAVGLDVRGNASAQLNAGSRIEVGTGTGLYADDSGRINFHGDNTASNYILAEKTGAHAINKGIIDLRHTTIGIERAEGSSSGVSAALAASNNGRIDASDSSVFYVSQDSTQPSYVIYANKGTATLNNVVLNTTGSNAQANITGLMATAGGRIDATGELYANMHSSTATALNAQGANSLINAKGLLGIYGAATASDQGRIKLGFEAGSSWQGAATQHNNGVIDVTLSQSHWIPLANSTVNELAVINSGVLDLRQLPTDHTVTVAGRLQGANDAKIHIRARVSPSNTENFDTRLIVNNSAGNSQGNFAVHVANDGAFDAQSRKAWTIVNTTGQAPSNLNFYSPYAIELGGYLYKVSPHANGKDWQVASLGNDPLPPKPDEDSFYEPLDPEPPVDPWQPPVVDPVVPPPDPDTTDPTDPVDPPVIPPVTPPVEPPIKPVKPDPDVDPNTIPITTTAKAAANMLTISYLLNISEQQTLVQRMGDLRLHGDKLHNFWIRGYGGHFNSFSNRKLDGFKMDYYGAQMGIDRRLGSLPLYAGMFVGYTHGDPKPTAGSANAKSYHGGFYATYLNETNGIYVDGVVKYNRFKHDFSVLDTEQQRVQGDTSTHGLSASIEVGKRFQLSEATQGWYLEPQMQHTFSHVNSTNFRASNGLNIRLDSYNSNIGRYGFALGYEMQNQQTEYNLYWKTAFVREFSGRGHYYLNGIKEDHNFRGNWWNNGLGINARINQRHDFYLEFDTNYGHNFNNFNVTGGYRLMF